MKKTKIYIVDDEPEDRQMLSDWLSEAGLEGAAFSRIGLMLEAYDFNAPGLVIMDFQMCTNGLDSWQMMKHARLGHVPVIFVSSGATPEIAERCISQGALAFMSKDPLNKAMLISCIKKVLSQPSPATKQPGKTPTALFSDLSQKELSLWELLAAKRNKPSEAADALGIKLTSLGTMRARIAAKLGFKTFTNALQTLKDEPIWPDEPDKCDNDRPQKSDK